jgi:hypothetical protein
MRKIKPTAVCFSRRIASRFGQPWHLSTRSRTAQRFGTCADICLQWALHHYGDLYCLFLVCTTKLDVITVQVNYSSVNFVSSF